MSETTTNKDELKTWLTEMLNSNVVKVTFTKKDGSVRVMNCTTDPSVLPSPLSEDSSSESKTVYDVDLKDWRSFRWDSVKEFDIEA